MGLSEMYEEKVIKLRVKVPKGATHFVVNGAGDPAGWWKIVDNVGAYHYSDINQRWVPLRGGAAGATSVLSQNELFPIEEV